MPGSRALRRLSLGLPTVLGLAKRGYFIPYRYAGGIPKAAERGGYPWIEKAFAEAEATFLSLLDSPDVVADIAERFRGAAPPNPRWEQTWFPRLDGLAAYLMTRRHRPDHIVEVGCGHSTRFVAAAAEDLGLTTRICAIDPAPRADIAALDRVTIHPMTLQTVPDTLFTDLAPGDFLMIDSSHIAMPGSDVDLLMGRIIPGLPAGVIVMIHDMFLPDPYPESWTWRGYNEQLPVAALLSGGGLEPLWSSHWIATRRPDVLRRRDLVPIPKPEDAPESALWLRKT
jgi:hypothetical protein